MAFDENHALTEAEIREITEYKRIIEFSEQVLAGTHPRIKIKFRLRRQSAYPSVRSFDERRPLSTLYKPAKKAAAPIPHQQQSLITIDSIDWQYSSTLACKRKRDEIEDVKWKTQAEEWDEPAVDGDDLQVWVGV